jgi:hypothetical protein
MVQVCICCEASPLQSRSNARSRRNAQWRFSINSRMVGRAAQRHAPSSRAPDAPTCSASRWWCTSRPSAAAGSQCWSRCTAAVRGKGMSAAQQKGAARVIVKRIMSRQYRDDVRALNQRGCWQPGRSALPQPCRMHCWTWRWCSSWCPVHLSDCPGSCRRCGSRGRRSCTGIRVLCSAVCVPCWHVGRSKATPQLSVAAWSLTLWPHRPHSFHPTGTIWTQRAPGQSCSGQDGPRYGGHRIA